MARTIKNIINGIRQALVLYPEADYVYPSKRGFYADALFLRRDNRRVARDLRKKTLEHGKQADHR